MSTRTGRIRRRAVAGLAALVALSFFAVLALLAPRPETAPPHSVWTPAPAAPGSEPPPTTSTPVPADALVVATDGDDAAPGTMQQPMRSIAAAVARAPEGGTVAVRSGVWHETVHLDSEITLRSWPGERVWLDGALPLDPAAFTPAGEGVWRLDGYPIRLDTSPTFTRGAPDNAEQGWQFVDPAYPLAADPQQIWLGDTALTQVGDVSEVGPGLFHVDTDAGSLHVGTDPAGDRPLAAGAVTKAVLITAPGARVEGIGIRRYVPPLPDFGAVTVDGAGAQIRDVLVTGSSTIGVSVQTHGVTLERVTVRESGMLGLHAHLADDLRLLDVQAVGNNTARFNSAPAAAGAKITMSRRLTVEGGTFSGNRGNGLWLDESVVDGLVTGVDANDNLVHGIQIELCSGVDVVHAVVAGNGDIGVSVQNSDHVSIRNTSAVANRRQIAFVQDGRRPSDPGAGGRLLPATHGLPTWVIGNSEVVDSVLSDSAVQGDEGAGHHTGRPPGDTLFAVEDYTKTLDAGSLDIRLRHNVYLRDSKARTRWTHVWTRPGDDPAVFTSLSEFRAATGQDAGSVEGDARHTAALTRDGTVGAGRSVPDSAPPPTAEFPRPPSRSEAR